jgi:hypothetical protein
MAKKIKGIRASLLQWSYGNRKVDKKVVQLHHSMDELAKFLQHKRNPKK